MTNNDTPQTKRTTLDQLFKCLSHPSRRRILTILAVDSPQEGEEFDSSDFKIADEELESFRIQLYHKHLPQLEQDEYITWDRDTDTIKRGPNFDEVRQLIELMENHQDMLPESWP